MVNPGTPFEGFRSHLMDERPKEARSFVAGEAERAATDLKVGIERLKVSLRDYRSRLDRDRDESGDGHDGHRQ